MKLLRHGPKGQEKPGLLDPQGQVRDLSALLPDITPATLAPAALAALRALDVQAIAVMFLFSFVNPAHELRAAEIVREQILRQTHEEVPHHATVETESWQERRDGSVRVDCTIYVGRASQKAILIGDGGARIKEIGRRAREELTRLLERRVHLFLNVKERPGWDEERARLRAIGLHEEEG